MLAGVVVDMFGSNPTYGVGKTMVPVISEVIHNKGKQPDSYRYTQIPKPELPDPNSKSIENESEYQSTHDAARSHQQAGEGITCFVFTF
jgi:hypothetical protein